ncbi:unnamed protein product [Brassica oleracea]
MFGCLDVTGYWIGWSMELKWQIVVRWLFVLQLKEELFICFCRRSVRRMQQVIYNETFKGNMTKSWMHTSC